MIKIIPKDKSQEFFLGFNLKLFLEINTILFAVLVNFLLTIFFSPEHFNATRVKEDVIVILLYNCPNNNRIINIIHSQAWRDRVPPYLSYIISIESVLRFLS